MTSARGGCKNCNVKPERALERVRCIMTRYEVVRGAFDYMAFAAEQSRDWRDLACKTQVRIPGKETIFFFLRIV